MILFEFIASAVFQTKLTTLLLLVVLNTTLLFDTLEWQVFNLTVILIPHWRFTQKITFTFCFETMFAEFDGIPSPSMGIHLTTLGSSVDLVNSVTDKRVVDSFVDSVPSVAGHVEERKWLMEGDEEGNESLSFVRERRATKGLQFGFWRTRANLAEPQFNGFDLGVNNFAEIPSNNLLNDCLEFLHLRKRPSFVRLLAGLEKRYPQLESLLCRHKILEVCSLRSAFGHEKLMVKIGRCPIRNESDVLVIIITESDRPCHFIHRLEKAGKNFRVSDNHYESKGPPKDFEKINMWKIELCLC